MSNISGAIETVGDTALLVAACRAIETEKPDAFFRDPFAARLAGERGMAIVSAVPYAHMSEFGIAIRTRLIDDLLLEALTTGVVKTVLSLGCGLDTRPWRLDLPSDLRWIEVDFAPMLDFKESLMAPEKPRCRRERLVADLNDPAQRQIVLQSPASSPTLIITEGLLMYLPGPTVNAIAAEAAQQSAIVHWISDITSTGFSKALGGPGTSHVRHVQAVDHLPGEQILQTICRHGWESSAFRSYTNREDLAFARTRIERMMAAAPEPRKPPEFPPNDPTGIHRFTRS